LTISPKNSRSRKLTRFAIFLLTRQVTITALHVETGYTRQHLRCVRNGETQPTLSCIAAIVSALRRLTLEPVRAEDVFELSLEEAGPWARARHDRSAAEIEAWNRERKALSDVLSQLPQYASEKWAQLLRREVRGPLAPLIRALVFEARALALDHAGEAMARLQLARELSGDLPRGDDAHALLIGRVSLEIAGTHHQSGNLAEAHLALDAAEAQFEGRSFCTNELGDAWLLRGTLALASGSLIEAAQHLRRATNIFSAVSDEHRVAKARIPLADVAYQLGRFEEARALWLATLPTLTAARDRKNLALVWLHLGWCAYAFADLADALSWFERAIPYLARLKLVLELARAHWGAALIYAHDGEHSRAIANFRLALSGFTGLQRFTDAVLAGIDLLQLLIVDPIDRPQALGLSLNLLNLLHHSGATHEAMTLLRRIDDAYRKALPVASDLATLRQLLRADAASPQFTITPQSSAAQQDTKDASLSVDAHEIHLKEPSQVDETEVMFALLRVPSVWQPDLIHPPQSMATLDASVRRLMTEQVTAANSISQTLTGPSAWWRTRLADTGDVHTIGFVRQLLIHADSLLGSAPADAVDACALAVEIADSIATQHYSFDLVLSTRAHAAREHAFALFYVGRFVDALAAVQRSEHRFRQLSLPEFELARVTLVRALIYRATDRIEEAISLSRQAAQTFAAFGDRQRFLKARMTEAAMLFSRRAAADALSVWGSLEQELATSGGVTFGMLLQNIGCCHRDLGHIDDAQSYFRRATELYEQLGIQVESVRTRWAIAQLLVSTSRFGEALPILREVWAAFGQLHIDGDAALAALEVVEVLLILDQPDDVPAICRVLLDRFAGNGMTSATVTALAFLREAVAAGRATPPLVRHVHDFVGHVSEYPERDFAPPPLI
jgi:tetratricopeptide (TPR) repeat protein